MTSDDDPAVPPAEPPAVPEVGRLLRAIRRRRRLSQRELAAASGIHYSTIGAIESGRRVPGLALLTQLLTATGHRLAVIDLSDDTDLSDDGAGESGSRIVSLDDEHDAIRDRGGRRFPAHLPWSGKPDYISDGSWWGWHRIAWYFPSDPAVPDHVYRMRPRIRVQRREPREHPFWN